MLGEILGEVIGQVIIGAVWHCFLTILGFLYLYGRYLQPQRVQTILIEQYANRYVNAGGAVMTKLMQMLGVLLLLTLWIGVAVLGWLHR